MRKRASIFLGGVLLILLISFYFAFQKNSLRYYGKPLEGDGKQADYRKFDGSMRPPDLTAIPESKQLPRYVSVSKANLDGYELPISFAISGEIRSEQGFPLGGAIVSFHSAGLSKATLQWPAPLISQFCDEMGRYIILLSSASHGFLVIRKDGYTQKEEEVELSIPGKIVKNYYLRSAPACVEGYIYDAQGKPISGAVVYSSVGTRRTTLDNSLFSMNTSTSRGDGKYVLYGIPEGLVMIGAASYNHLEQVEWINLIHGKCGSYNFRLADGIDVHLTIKNAEGEPISGALACGKGSANDSGEINFKVPVESAIIDCSINANGYKSKSIKMDPLNPPGVVVLERGPILRGRIITEENDPMDRVKVMVSNAGVIYTDGDGRFLINLSSNSTFTIVISKVGFIERRLMLDVNESGPEEVVITMVKSEAGIYGRVVEKEQIPVKRFRILLRDISDVHKSDYSRDFENVDGTFVITDVPCGNYNLSILSLPFDSSIPSVVMTIENVSIRKGLMFGELQANLTAREIGKKE